MNEWPCMPHTSGCRVLVKRKKKKNCSRINHPQNNESACWNNEEEFGWWKETLFSHLMSSDKWEDWREDRARVKLLKTKRPKIFCAKRVNHRRLHQISFFCFVFIYTHHDSTPSQQHQARPWTLTLRPMRKLTCFCTQRCCSFSPQN